MRDTHDTSVWKGKLLRDFEVVVFRRSRSVVHGLTLPGLMNRERITPMRPVPVGFSVRFIVLAGNLNGWHPPLKSSRVEAHALHLLLHESGEGLIVALILPTRTEQFVCLERAPQLGFAGRGVEIRQEAAPTDGLAENAKSLSSR